MTVANVGVFDVGYFGNEVLIPSAFVGGLNGGELGGDRLHMVFADFMCVEDFAEIGEEVLYVNRHYCGLLFCVL